MASYTGSLYPATERGGSFTPTQLLFICNILILLIEENVC